MSARDINVTSRGATGTLATGQLALLDGRSLYQDFFGFVMWDFLPVNLNEVKQIEVIRGPASAVWGANALYGVVNVITKIAARDAGHERDLRLRRLRSARTADAGLALVCERHACRSAKRSLGVQALGRRLLAGRAVAADRHDPVRHARGLRRSRPASIRAFTNTARRSRSSTRRVDYDYEDGRKLSFSGGVAGTDGIMHTGIGPFDITSGTVMGYGKANYTKGGFRARLLHQHPERRRRQPADRDASTASRSPSTSTPTPTTSTCRTCRRFAERHVVSYGGNLRFNLFDLSIAPPPTTARSSASTGRTRSSSRTMFRWSSARASIASTTSTTSCSRRATTFMIKPRREPDVPGLLQPRLSLAVGDQQPPRPGHRAAGQPRPSLGVAERSTRCRSTSPGNPDLEEQSLDAFEIGYSGVVANGRAMLSAAFYINWLKNDILFTAGPTASTPRPNPPPNWPLPPIVHRRAGRSSSSCRRASPI